MKIPKILVHYGAMFFIPTGVAFYYWQPRTDEEIRGDIERQIKPDQSRRAKNHAKFNELLLHRDHQSEESKKQIELLTKFAPTNPKDK